MKRQRNSEVDFFFNKAEAWREEFELLRDLLLGFPLEEELKWGKPCYTLNGGNVVIIQGFKAYCALLFPKGVLLKDHDRLLIRQTENVQAARQLRFTSAAEITKRKTAIKTCIKEAIAVEKAGLEVAYKKTSEFAVPNELKVRFDEDPGFKTAFASLTPGRQRGYLLYFSGAKQSKTREARIEKSMTRIFEGKGLDDR